MIGLLSRLPPSLRDTALYGGSLAWTKALTMVTLPLLTSMLAPVDFARLELLSSAAELGALLAGAGLIDTAYRFAGRDDADGRRAMAQVIGLGIAIALGCIALVVLLAPVLSAGMPLATSSFEIILLGIAVALEALIGVPLAWMRMRGRAGRYAMVTVARATGQAALVVAFVANGWGVTGVLIAGAMAAVAAAFVLTLGQARATGVRMAPNAWGRLAAYGLPLVGGGFATFLLGTADRWLLAGSVPAEALGHYALAAKLALIAALLTQPFELWWYPRRIALLDAPDGLARSARVVTAGVVLIALSAAATAAIGPLLIQVLTPPAYHPAAAFVPWLALGLALQSLGSLLNVGCYARRTGMIPMAVNGVAAMVAVAGYLVLIPVHGVAGAIAATLLAQTARLVLFLVLSQRWVRLPLSATVLVARVATCAAAGMFSVSGDLAVVAIPLLVLVVPAAIGSGAWPCPTLSWLRGVPARA